MIGYESQYLILCKRILNEGVLKPQRAILRSTGKRPNCYSFFGGAQLHIDLQLGFPLLTTKKMLPRLIVGELLWMLSGSTNVRELQKKQIHIWDQWADSEGELGPVYGKQWRAYEGPDGKIDQISRLVDGIRRTHADPYCPDARRLILNSWHPAHRTADSVPMGCHTMAQFDVTHGRLSGHVFQRSADMFLGLPFNVSVYALLLHLLAKVCKLAIARLIFSIGNAHIYDNHVDQIREQMKRTSSTLPQLLLDPSITSMDNIDDQAISFSNYHCGPPLIGEVAV